jgi:predicted nucleic acid-binding Zn ribbon protein
MPLYIYKSNENKEIAVMSSWSEVKEMDTATPDELINFLRLNLVPGEENMPVSGEIYRRVLCKPSLQFRGSGWHVTDYPK